MNITYSKTFGRKLLVAFLIFAILFSITFFFVRSSVIGKLLHVSEVAINASNDQSRPERALLLLHLAEDNFQQSLLASDYDKITDYRTNLAKAFDVIDTLLNEQKDNKYSQYLNPQQRKQLKLWYSKKVNLSSQFYTLKHNFDSLLFLHSAFQKDLSLVKTATKNLSRELIRSQEKVRTDTSQTRAKKKGVFGRIKDAIQNKADSAVFLINRSTSIEAKELAINQVTASDRNLYVKRLNLLQLQNIKLQHMQRQLTVLNTNIINDLENIIAEVKENDYNFTSSFKALALKNYQETTIILNKFSLVNLLLIVTLAACLIFFIVKLNDAELLLRKENKLAISKSNEKIAALVERLELTEGKQEEYKIEALKEVVELAMANNPAFLLKFNEFDIDFCKKLQGLAPSLVATELEFCVMTRLNFETKEIAQYTKSSVRSIESKKYRIRKKLNIPSEQDFNLWMANL